MLFTDLIHLGLASLSFCLGCAAAYISLLCSVQTRHRFCLAPLSSIVPHLSLPLCLLHLFSSHFLFVFPLLCSLVVRFRSIILSSLLNYSLHLLWTGHYISCALLLLLHLFYSSAISYPPLFTTFFLIFSS